MQFLGLRILMNRIRVIPYFLRDKTVPLRKKLLVVAGIIYIIAPIDLVPVFPLDDLVLWIYILWHLKDDLDQYWKGEKNVDLSKKFRDKDIVDGVEFTVNDKGEKSGDSSPDNNGEG